MASLSKSARTKFLIFGGIGVLALLYAGRPDKGEERSKGLIDGVSSMLPVSDEVLLREMDEFVYAAKQVMGRAEKLTKYHKQKMTKEDEYRLFQISRDAFYLVEPIKNAYGRYHIRPEEENKKKLQLMLGEVGQLELKYHLKDE